jgi:4-hydroxy-tetrahydrodipicolinate synthase
VSVDPARQDGMGTGAGTSAGTGSGTESEPGAGTGVGNGGGVVDGGVLVPLVTPFRRGQVDWDSLRRAARWFAARRVDALWLNGTTSEFHALREDEIIEVVRVVAEAVPADCLVIAHVGAPATRLALRLAGPCAEAGADAVCAVPPYYLPYSDDEVLGYFRAIRGAAGIPLLAYNIPALTKLAVSQEMILRLTAEGTITGVKDTQWTVPQVAALAGAAGRAGVRVPVFTGDATMLAGAMRAGAAGTVTAISNVVPLHCMRLVSAARRGDREAAASLQPGLAAAVAATVVSTRPASTPRMASVKYLLAELGVIDDPETAAPFQPLTAGERAELTAGALPLVRRLEDEAKNDLQTTGNTGRLSPGNAKEPRR